MSKLVCVLLFLLPLPPSSVSPPSLFLPPTSLFLLRLSSSLLCPSSFLPLPPSHMLYAPFSLTSSITTPSFLLSPLFSPCSLLPSHFLLSLPPPLFPYSFPPPSSPLPPSPPSGSRLCQSEMETLLETQEELKKGSQRINQMLQEMENKQVQYILSLEVKQIFCFIHAQTLLQCCFS